MFVLDAFSTEKNAIFHMFMLENIGCDAHKKLLVDALLMRTHNIRFFEK